MSGHVNVRESALTQAQRDALARTKPEWRRLPAGIAGIAADLERCGLVETRVDWVWSARNPGAGKHVVFWRRRAAIASMGEPVRHDDGALKQTMLKVNGKRFRCECGCNVFHQPDAEVPDRYACNGCDLWYIADPTPTGASHDQ